MEKINYYKTEVYKLTSYFFCSVMIAVFIVGFASCEKENEKDNDNNSLVGTTWRAYVVNPDTHDQGIMEIKFTSATIGVSYLIIDGNPEVIELTFTYYKDGDYWQMRMENGNSVGRFTINGNTLFWHRPNGTTLSYTKV